MSRTMWTSDMDTILLEKHGEGLPFAEIGKLIGVSKNAIAGRCHRLNLDHRVKPKKPRLERLKAPRRSVVDELVILREVQQEAQGSVDPKGAVEAILALQWRSCRYSFGDPRDSDFHFCMERTILGKSLCREHYELSYVKEKRR